MLPLIAARPVQSVAGGLRSQLAKWGLEASPDVAEMMRSFNSLTDPAARRAFVTQRHVHAQLDCRSCWARYLCSGGCHQEASARSTASCDFIRGWLAFCLAAYCELGGPTQAMAPSVASRAEEVRP